MPYIPNGPLTPEGLGELVVVLEVSQRDAREHLRRFQGDPSFPKKEVIQAQRFFEALLMHNERLTAMIVGWQMAGKLTPELKDNAKKVLFTMGQISAVAVQIIQTTRTYGRDPKAELQRVPLSALPMVRADIERDIAGTARDLQHLEVGARASLPVVSKEDLDNMIAGYEGVLPAISCYPALVRKWRKGKLTAGQREELKVLKGRIDLLLSQVAAVLVAAKAFTGKVMTQEPNAFVVNLGQSFVVD